MFGRKDQVYQLVFGKEANFTQCRVSTAAKSCSRLQCFDFSVLCSFCDITAHNSHTILTNRNRNLPRRDMVYIVLRFVLVVAADSLRTFELSRFVLFIL